MEYFFIVNPQAGAHNVQKLWPDIETELGCVFKLFNQ
mgnify:CR=1 FL=1